MENPLDLHQRYFMPPYRFAYVDEGLSRGAYPTLRNFRYLARLQLSTIISLTPESPTKDLEDYANAAGIHLIHFPVLRTAPFNAGLMSSLQSAVKLCLDIDTHPSIYVHCLDGRRICGLFVLLIRRLQGWSPMSAFTEYWRHQLTMKQSMGILDLKKATEEIGKFLQDFSEPVVIPTTIPRWLWGGDRSCGLPAPIVRNTDAALSGKSLVLSQMSRMGQFSGSGIADLNHASGAATDRYDDREYRVNSLSTMKLTRQSTSPMVLMSSNSLDDLVSIKRPPSVPITTFMEPAQSQTASAACEGVYDDVAHCRGWLSPGLPSERAASVFSSNSALNLSRPASGDSLARGSKGSSPGSRYDDWMSVDDDDSIRMIHLRHSRSRDNLGCGVSGSRKPPSNPANSRSIDALLLHRPLVKVRDETQLRGKTAPYSKSMKY